MKPCWRDVGVRSEEDARKADVLLGRLTTLLGADAAYPSIVDWVLREWRWRTLNLPGRSPAYQDRYRQENGIQGEASGVRPAFSYEAVAKQIQGKPEIGAWTDGVTLHTEESEEDRWAGFVPAYRLKLGRRYRITIEELPADPPRDP